ncbi:hypothetical protein AWZ03_013894, partial [Drosophila navojoa]
RITKLHGGNTGWVSYPLKTELEVILTELGLEPHGLVDELRRRLTAYINRDDHSEESDCNDCKQQRKTANVADLKEYHGPPEDEEDQGPDARIA